MRTSLNILVGLFLAASASSWSVHSRSLGRIRSSNIGSVLSQHGVPGPCSECGCLSSVCHDCVGVILCDHGSRKSAANDLIIEVSQRFRELEATELNVVEIAHMELAEPTISDAFDKCVEAGAKTVVCQPFFLGPGKHVTSDIPAMMKDVASKHPNVRWTVSEPLGLSPLMPRVIKEAVNKAIGKKKFTKGGNINEL